MDSPNAPSSSTNPTAGLDSSGDDEEDSGGHHPDLAAAPMVARYQRSQPHETHAHPAPGSGQTQSYGSINESIKFVVPEISPAVRTPACSGEQRIEIARVGAPHAVPPIQTLLVLSLATLLVATPYNGNQNIQSSINSQGGLGVITLACVYATVIFGAPLATSVIRKVGCKRLLLLHWTTNGIFIAGNFYPKFYTLLPVSILTGITSSYLGTLNGLYLTAASESYISREKMSRDKQHTVLSIFFGVFFTFANMSQVTGNLISSAVLFSRSSPRGNMSEIKSASCGAGLCPGENLTATAFTPPGGATLDILYGIFVGSVLLGFLLTIFLMPNLRVGDETSSACREISGCYRVLLNARYALLTPIIVAQAMIVMILFTGFTQAFVSCNLGVEWVGFIMMTYGASAATFATVANYLARYLGRISLMITFILIDSGLLLTFLMWNSNSKLVLFSLAATAGVSEGISQPQFNSIISLVFRDELTPAFVAYNMVKCFGFSVSLVMSSFACLYHRLYLALALYGLGLVGYIATEVLSHQKNSPRDQVALINNKDKSVKKSSFKKTNSLREHKL